MDKPDPEAAIERTAAELEHDLEKLDSHLDEAHSADKARRAEFPDGSGEPGDSADTPAGDVSGQEGGPMFGEDAAGSDEDGDAREAARES